MTSSKSKRPALAALAVLLGVSAFVAGVSGWVTAQNVGAWYAALAKPPFNPPGWVFGPVWTVLYIAMAVAAWRVWSRRGRTPAGSAMGFYAAQMTLNFAWSLIFFGLHRIAAALLDIVVLAALVAATLVVFRRRDPIAGALMAPYLAWVLFAAVLNGAIWWLN